MSETKESFCMRSKGCGKRQRNALPLRTLMLGATALSFGALFAATAPNANAWALYSGTIGGQDMEVNLDTAVEYSNIFRVNNPSAVLAGPDNANGNDGDSNFPHGLVDNSLDVSPIFDVKWGSWGLHFSGEAYLDTPYLGTNANSQPGTFNPYTTVDNQHFTSGTRNIQGQNAVLLDAFVSKNFNFGGQSASLRFGRQTLLWGQSLIFTGNGIAAGQAPLDINKELSQPGALAQQLFLPIGQVVASYQPNQIVTLQAYYQFEWQPDTFEGSGAYFNTTDFLDKGGQRLDVDPVIGGPALWAYRGKDNRPTHNGQFGASAQLTLGDYDVGFYGLRFDSKTPEVYLGLPNRSEPAGAVGTYSLVYPRDIAIYGASLSTDVGAANVGGEISTRTNMPLVGGIGLLFNPATGAPVDVSSSHPLYPVGDTLHAQASTIYLTPGIPLDPGGLSIDGEVEFNHLLHVSQNRAALAQGRNASAASFGLFVTPQYYGVLPNLEIEFPVTLIYNALGDSQIDASMNHGTGQVSFGVTAVYKTTWTATATYQDYIGAPNPNLSGDASLADRGFLAFTVQHTF